MNLHQISTSIIIIIIIIIIVLLIIIIIINNYQQLPSCQALSLSPLLTELMEAVRPSSIQLNLSKTATLGDRRKWPS